MSLDWSCLPLLPLKCILEHLSTKEALAATTTCRNWRNAILLYDGHKEILKLHAKNYEKNMFVTRIFRKYTRILHIYIDCDLQELVKFMNSVLPQFLDTEKLNEIIFIGPSYLQQKPNVPVLKLNRVITETLVFKHLHCIQNLQFMGCELEPFANESDRLNHKLVEVYSRALKFNGAPLPARSILSQCNEKMMMFSMLQHILIDYEYMTTEAIETLSQLTLFKCLSINVRAQKTWRKLDWLRLQNSYPSGLNIAVNIIALPYNNFDDVIENILVEDLPLTSLKVMFCKTVYSPLLKHIVRAHKSTLREIVWVDTPNTSHDPNARFIKPMPPYEYENCSVNPFILMCWQCVHLQRLVIHGYWVWQYDVLGFFRLRKSLQDVQISAMYGTNSRLASRDPLAGGAMRVMAGDTQEMLVDDGDVSQQINEFTEMKWKQTRWCDLHPGLHAFSKPEQRFDYVLQEVKNPLGVTLYYL